MYQDENNFFSFESDSFNSNYDNQNINPVIQDQDVEIKFNDINKIMNLQNFSEENEYLYNQDLYFIKDEIKKEEDYSFLSKKRNNNSSIEEKQEFEKESKINPEEIKKEAKIIG